MSEKQEMQSWQCRRRTEANQKVISQQEESGEKLRREAKSRRRIESK
jgi:hypothetical protein